MQLATYPAHTSLLMTMQHNFVIADTVWPVNYVTEPVLIGHDIFQWEPGLSKPY